MEKQRQVVVAYDFSLHGQAVLERAVSLVSRAPFHVLHFITVIDSHSGVELVPPGKDKIDYIYVDRVREKMLEQIGLALRECPVAADVHFFVHARIGKPAIEILSLAKEVGADLVLIGTHGLTGLERLVLGSVAERVVREAGCAVMVVRPKVYPDVELMKVIEVNHQPNHWRAYRFSYANHDVIVRPPEWPVH
jgi:nucleotide-binding universal stress UspA family protein